MCTGSWLEGVRSWLEGKKRVYGWLVRGEEECVRVVG